MTTQTNRRKVTAAWLALTLCVLSACTPIPEIPPVRTVLLVRHAEKRLCAQPGPNCVPGNEPLTSQGGARANELAHVAGMANVKAVYSTDYIRTMSTVEPLANSASLTTTTYTTLAQLVSGVQSMPTGQTALVAGHSNTLPPIVNALGGPSSLCPEGYEYDKLCVITLHENGVVNVLHLQYGEPSLPDSGEGETITAQIRASGPDGAVLGSANALVPAPQTTGAQPLATFVFTPTINVNPGDTYVVEWLAPGNALLTWMASDSAPYSGGMAFGCTGIAVPGRDCLFTTYRDSTAIHADQVSQAQTGLSIGCGTPPYGTIAQGFTPSSSPLAAVDLRLRVGGQFPGATAREVTTVVLVRDEPPGASVERAAALAQYLFKAGVTAIYASPTENAVQRLADVRGLDVQSFSLTDIGGFAGQLLAQPAGRLILVASTADAVVDIISELGGSPIPSAAAVDVDDLFLVTLYDEGPAHVLHLQYGQESP